MEAGYGLGSDDVIFSAIQRGIAAHGQNRMAGGFSGIDHWCALRGGNSSETAGSASGYGCIY